MLVYLFCSARIVRWIVRLTGKGVWRKPHAKAASSGVLRRSYVYWRSAQLEIAPAVAKRRGYLSARVHCSAAYFAGAAVLYTTFVIVRPGPYSLSACQSQVYLLRLPSR